MAKKADALNLFPQTAQHNIAATKKSSGRKESTSELTELELMWRRCLDIIRDNISLQVYRTWFEPIRVCDFNDDEITLQVPSQFYYEWLEEHYNTLIQRSVAQVFGAEVNLKYQVVVDNTKESLEQRTITLPAMRHSGQTPTIQSKLPFVPSSPQSGSFSSYLNPRYTFDNFIHGESNQLAFSASLAVTENPGKTRFNPLVIYGNTGLGKTHLVQAIGNRILEKNKRARVLYTTSERFTMEYVSALQTHKFSEFTAYYRSMDVLIVDDIQFFAGKEKTQDNFFHTFNALHQAGKQIILTSDVSPKELKDVDARLISRFQWGLTADIQAPDFEMRLAIVNKKSADEGLQLPMDVAEYIARHVSSSIRHIEGCLISLFAKVSLDRREISIDLVKEVVHSVIGESRQRPLSMEDIKTLVASYYNLPIELLAGKTRKHEIVLARQVAMYLAKQLTNLSLKSIGSHFGGRDHTTVLHSIQMIENYFDTDKTVTESVEHLQRKLARDW